MDHFGRDDFVEPLTELEQIMPAKIDFQIYIFFPVASLNKPLTCKQCAVRLNIFLDGRIE